MRVVAGTLKGRSIKAVKGTNTRPTTDKVKESIFNIIGPYFDGGIALDLFGGSGNLGIESLSRGIDKVIFVDRETIAINTIKENVKDLRIEDCVEIYRNDYFRALKALVKRDIQFDLILLDPPYKGQKINEIIEFVNEHNLLASGGIIMAECLKEDELHEMIGDIKQVKREIYGITSITIYHRD
ncbi:MULTISPECIES: 16S rRNA (guanine(966)-N(2))-methyltransferase RsmD [Turicibacter]|jgi:RNA methyltransferase, rsmD family|uniref:16S rRNA (Guanine(966)-N(2))-methyltransferase RsmD n=3 Tax=Turicibacter sanguinis TaxID=154288 RepID=A0A173R208_9FIRM|nr:MULTISPECIES: 16S rRNA (guanine(966)-N(2))-methyltransferase RsmD [Turicibacter]KAB3586017.1 16S rRNA (guanine(966)-N(2))-methyltransferase RsmD [Phocaeicola vulgatus]EFF64652.1 RNA methyltransferase, RsmD family [Turicibacter sanguinis PC909]EGC93242.1 RNA methyltransferase, RsmD family [Turicibacter sp. HGF1]MBP3905143.1 16S rRNA (guanine(966)-N(2))-methyltransferase RsmD [Turicibacter sp.]MCU7191300.1 16S rRNA (guanine(966)-N(2))-methyltransferase RsmD [Turicibacter sanguinis]